MLDLQSVNKKVRVGSILLFAGFLDVVIGLILLMVLDISLVGIIIIAAGIFTAIVGYFVSSINRSIDQNNLPPDNKNNT